MKIIAQSDDEEKVIENITKVKYVFCYNPIENSIDLYRHNELVESFPEGVLNGMIIEVE